MALHSSDVDYPNSNTDHVSLLSILKAFPSLLLRAPRARKAIKFMNHGNEFVSLGKVLDYTASKYPNNPFIYYEGRKISYKEFNDYSNKMAHYLDKQGIKKGDVVALLFDNRPEFLMCAVALVKLGAIAALLNPLQRGQILLHSINLVKSKGIIVGEELLDSFRSIEKEAQVDSHHKYFVSDNDLLQGFDQCPEGFINLPQEANSFSNSTLSQVNKVHRKDSCFYIYTSGTTGMPKASVTNHDRWVGAYAGIGHGLVQLNSDDVFYCPLPFYHATAMLVCWGSIIAGGSSFVLKRKFSASEFWKDVSAYKVTAFGYVGELCRYLLNQTPNVEDKQHKIRLILGNGLRPSAWKPFKERFNIQRVIEFYGASEGNVGFINLFNLDNTIGLGSHNLAVVKYDQENEKPITDSNNSMIKVKKGEAGLLLGQISNITPFPGYTDKNQTQKAIFYNVFKEGDQWFNTGDLVRNIGWRHYQFVDRIGDTFRWKGENVSTTELENICMQYEDIEDCIAYGVEIPETNGRIGMLSVCLKSQNPDTYNFEGFHSFLKEQLPTYAIPHFIRIKNSLETTGTFKHKKADLKNEAYHLKLVKDPLYVLLPKAGNTYQKIDDQIYTSIMSNEYRF